VCFEVTLPRCYEVCGKCRAAGGGSLAVRGEGGAGSKLRPSDEERGKGRKAKRARI
jgi:hypothetical protein